MPSYSFTFLYTYTHGDMYGWIKPRCYDKYMGTRSRWTNHIVILLKPCIIYVSVGLLQKGFPSWTTAELERRMVAPLPYQQEIARGNASHLRNRRSSRAPPNGWSNVC